jgi:hypothetical protein
MHDIAQRADLAKTLKSRLRLTYGAHNAKAEARIIVYRNSHKDVS